MTSTFAERLKEALANNNMSAAELCRLTKTPESVMSQYKAGKYVAKQKRLDAYSQILNVSIPWLMGEDVPMNCKADELPKQSNTTFLDNKNIYIAPVYESVSAGFGAYAADYITDYMPCYVPNKAEAEETICVIVNGDSMFPKIENGDIIQVHKQTSVDNGAIAVVLLDKSEALVKKAIYGTDWIELHSINPMYPIQRFEGQDVLRIEVLGLVRKIIKNV